MKKSIYWTALLLAILVISILVLEPLVTRRTTVTTPSSESQLEEAQDKLASDNLRAQNSEYWEKVSNLLQKTLAGVSAVRELPVPEQVGFRVVTADWSKERFGERYVKDNAKRIEIDERIFKGLFILQDADSLESIYTEWPKAYISAVMENKIYFIQENFGRLNGQEMRDVLAHEGSHLLQGERLNDPAFITYDAEKAWMALREGDAGFSRTRYLNEVTQAEPVPEIDNLSADSLGSVPKSERPDTLNKLIRFPYEYGESFVSSLYQRGGWQSVNETWEKPPITEEQVMHPEKYLAGEVPSGIEALPLNITGWQEEKTDGFGEYFIKVMLGAWLPDLEAASAASGWGNDRFTYYSREQSYLFTWQTAWDSEQDASEFSEAFLRMLEKVGGTQLPANLWLVKSKYFWIAKTANQEVLIVATNEKSMVYSVQKAIQP